MATEEKKKTKIDLKQRLGKTQAGTSSVPLPVPGVPSAPGSAPSQPAPSSDGVPPPIPAPTPSVRPAAAPVGLSPGIPLPPFAQPRPAPQAAPSKPTAAQQTIKVEVGEEVHQERKKATGRIALAAVLAALAGVGIGFVIGQQKEKSDRGSAAVKSAADLEKDIKVANEKIEALIKAVEEGSAQISSKESPAFPAELEKTLSEIVIPFENDKLENRVIPPKLLPKMLKFVQGVQRANEDKDDLKNTLPRKKGDVEKFWKDQKDPVFAFSVVFSPDRTGKGMMAELVQNKDQFEQKKDWPKVFKIFRNERQGQQVQRVEKDAARWEKGDLTASDKPVAIPVDPITTPFGENAVLQIQVKMLDIVEIVKGKFVDTPQEVEGIQKMGKELEAELHKIAIAK